MRNFIRNIVLILTTLTIAACPNIKPKANTRDHTKHWFKRQPNTVWHDMRRHFTLLTPENKEQAQQALKWYLKHPKTLESVFKQSQPYIAYIYQQTQEQGMPAELALLPIVESNYNPFLFSNAGATGLWQLMPGTATGMGLNINWWFDSRRDVIASTKASLAYLNYLHHFFNAWLPALGAYNSGEGTVQHALRYAKKHNTNASYWDLHLPKETESYVPKLIAIAMIVDHPNRYGIILPSIDHRVYFSQIHMNQSIDINTMAKWAHLSKKELRLLNPGFRRETTPSHQSFTLLLPSDHVALFNNAKAIATATPSPQWQHHIVNQGENLSVIAQHYHTSINAIEKSNRLKNGLIHPGQSLMIPKNNKRINKEYHASSANIAEDHLPGPIRVNYEVKHGDSLASIARHFGITHSAILYWNHHISSRHLKPNQHLIIWLTPKNHRHHHYQFSYTVKANDTLSGIANRFQSNIKTIRLANQIKKDKIRIGQKLIISGNQQYAK